MSDFKDRVKNAIYKYIEKQTPKVSVKRKNEKPEKAVEREVLKWCRDRHWDINVVESKSTWSESAGRYISQSVSAGFSDLAGNTDLGLSVFIELKAPRRLSTLRPQQREFLLRKIGTGCFAVCVDSSLRLEDLWNGFCKAYDKKEYLVSVLPKVRELEGRDLNFDE
jgi:hypothetical protein